VLGDLLSVLAEQLDADCAWFVPVDPSAATARSRRSDVDDASELVAAAQEWLRAPADESAIISLDKRSVALCAVRSDSGALRGVLLVARGVELELGPVELAAALMSAVLDTATFGSARQALLDWAAARTGPRAAFALSIDGLGVANEVLGFAAGDQLLGELVARIAEWAGPNGRIAGSGARYLAIRDDIDDPAQALAEAERLRALLAQEVRLANLPVSRSASIGVAADPSGATSPEALLANAVRCCAAARSAGGDRCELFDDAATGTVLDRLRLGLELHSAVTSDQLRIHYQPEFDLESGAVVAVEALLRWQHPLLGLLSAESFVPEAEQTHTFAAVQRWVIEEACRQLAQWRRSARAAELVLRLNVPGFLAVEADTDAALRAALAHHGVPPERICVELTERRMPTDLSALAAQLRGWQDLGIVLALDDFGVAEGTLTHLLDLPVNLVKIDQSFVARMATDERARAIVTGVIKLAESLHLDVVAEGIDGPDAVRALVSAGCTRGQGNVLAAAMGPDEISELLQLSD
jgi:EAL domain-containing protein (putative c-di-GMP-specific phosphodiesterase class I)/GGDEF domain-containing protein